MTLGGILLAIVQTGIVAVSAPVTVIATGIGS